MCVSHEDVWDGEGKASRAPSCSKLNAFHTSSYHMIVFHFCLPDAHKNIITLFMYRFCRQKDLNE